MKKQLFVIRHATAEESVNLSVVRDFDRELVSKGIMESARLGKFLSENAIKPDAVYSSGAARALGTAKMVCEQWKFDTEKITVKEALYGSGPRGYMEVVNSIPESVETAVVVGHNPDITYFVDYLTKDDAGGNMKKATAIHLEFEGLNWIEISQGSGSFVMRVDGKTL